MIQTPKMIRLFLICIALAAGSAQVLSQTANTPDQSPPQPESVRLKLTDGTYLVVDDAWETVQGIWYRQGSLSHLAPKDRVKSIERGNPAPPKETTARSTKTDGPLYMRPVEQPPPQKPE